MTARKAGDTPPDAPVPTDPAGVREAKGSVHEAIGKLIGDDGARDRGSAERRAGAAAATPPSPRSPRR